MNPGPPKRSSVAPSSRAPPTAAPATIPRAAHCQRRSAWTFMPGVRFGGPLFGGPPFGVRRLFSLDHVDLAIERVAPRLQRLRRVHLEQEVAVPPDVRAVRPRAVARDADAEVFALGVGLL